MIGNDKARLGMVPRCPVRSARLADEAVVRATVTVDAPGDSWQVEFFDPVTGKSTGESRMAVRDRRVRIVLPEFQGSIAVRLKRLEP